MPVDHRTHQPYGLLHGGASVVLAETLGSSAAMLTLDPEKELAVGLDINANHIRGVSSGTSRDREDAAYRSFHPGMGNPHRERGRRAGVHIANDHGGGAGTRRGFALNETPYANLSPDLVLDAVTACGLWPDGRLLALNSYENRVWQVGLEDRRPSSRSSIAPVDGATRRSSKSTVCARMADAELPVVAPLVFGGHTMLHHDGFRYALSPRHGGRAPELESPINWNGWVD